MILRSYFITKFALTHPKEQNRINQVVIVTTLSLTRSITFSDAHPFRSGASPVRRSYSELQCLLLGGPKTPSSASPEPLQRAATSDNVSLDDQRRKWEGEAELARGRAEALQVVLLNPKSIMEIGREP